MTPISTDSIASLTRLAANLARTSGDRLATPRTDVSDSHPAWCALPDLEETAACSTELEIAGSGICPGSAAPQEDAELLRLHQCLDRARKREAAAAEELIEHLLPLVMRIVHSRRTRRDDAEDLAQDIFLKIFSRLDQYRGEVPFHHWVSRIAVNHCLNAIRHERKRPEWRWSDLPEEQIRSLPAEPDLTRGEPLPLQQMAAREWIEQLLSTLDPADALLLRWLEMEDRTVEEIRQMTGWSSTRIRVRAFRARRRLNRRFAQIHQRDQP